MKRSAPNRNLCVLRIFAVNGYREKCQYNTKIQSIKTERRNVMKTVVFYENGGVDKLTYTDVEKPKISPRLAD